MLEKYKKLGKMYQYQIEASGFLQTGSDIFGSSKPILSIDTDSYVIIPNTLSFDELESDIDYSVSDENHVAQINYSYHGTYLGSAYLNVAADTEPAYEFDTAAETTDVSVERTETETSPATTIFVNVKKVLIGILLFAGAVIALFIVRALIVNRTNMRRRRNRIRRKQRRRERLRSELDDFDF